MTLLARRWPRTHAPGDAARRAGEAIREHQGPRSRFGARLDPEAATGLALTLALVLAIGGGVVLAVLALLVRADGDLVQLDNSVANWGAWIVPALCTASVDQRPSTSPEPMP